ncbi:MAG: hypothetical protein K8S87_00230 [Planctomycetes bacterium]|nr:hypothetical protein [Planctomycetota bacterium]
MQLKSETWLISTIILLIFTSVLRADIRTQWDDVEIVVSGEAEFHGVAVDPFFTSLDADDEWNYYLVGLIELSLDVRFSEYTGIYFSMKNAKTTTGKTFGDGIVRAKGSILGADSSINMTFDEAFFALDRIFMAGVEVRAGLMHIKIGLDTSVENWFDGHGQLFMDTEYGRIGENLETEFFPAGISGKYSTGKGFQLRGGWFFMHKDVDDYNNDIQFSFVDAEYSPSPFSTYISGISSWQQRGNHFQSYWVGSKLAIDSEFSTYAFGVFHAGADVSSRAYYVGLKYITLNKIYFFDFSFWYLDGNNPASVTNENYFNTASLSTTMILDDANIGIGLNRNYTAIKVVSGFRFSYSSRLLIIAAYYDRIYSGSGPKPGNEIDTVYRMNFSSRFIVDFKAGYLFDTEIVPNNADAWMFAICVKAKY